MLRIRSDNEIQENLATELSSLRVGDLIDFYCISSGTIPRYGLVSSVDAESIGVVELTPENCMALNAGQPTVPTDVPRSDFSEIINKTRCGEERSVESDAEFAAMRAPTATDNNRLDG